eukprot:scaffold30492_cov47-Attheya_sp.AAC.4
MEGVNENDDVVTPSTPMIRYWGLYQYVVISPANYCSSIDLLIDSSQGGFKLDGSWKAARAFGVLAAIFGGITMLLLLTPLCMSLTFLIFKTDTCESSANTSVNCSIDEGGSTAIAAMVFYLLAAIVICKTPYPDAPLFKFSQDPNVDTTSTAITPQDEESKEAHDEEVPEDEL